MKRAGTLFLLTLLFVVMRIEAATVVGQLSVTGSLSISTGGVDFLPAGTGTGDWTATADGQTGSFAPEASTTGKFKDATWSATSVSNFITLLTQPAYQFTLTSFDPGVFSSASCGSAPAAGQTCTPTGTPFNFTNLTSSSSTLTFVAHGTLTNGVDWSNWIATFSTQFAAANYQQVEAILAGSGSAASSFSAVIQAAAPSADLSITKNDGVTTVPAGGTTTYTITVTNAGPDTATAAPVTDTFDAAIASATWTCTASAGSSCGAANGTGNISTTVTLLSGGSATFTVMATVSPTASGTLTNNASVGAAPNTSDPNMANNGATDTDTIVAPILQIDLSVTKTNGATTILQGGTTTWTIVVRNNGPATATSASVTDPLPTGISSATWTCTASAGSTCGAANGSGGIATTVTLLTGGTATFVMNAQVSPTASGTISNTATAFAPAGSNDTNTTNNAATDADVVTTIPVPVPALDGLGLLAMMIALAMVAGGALRK